ncbi:ATP-binding protein [Streptomyces sp. NPDC001889]
MTSNPHHHGRTTLPISTSHHLITTVDPYEPDFVMRFTSTLRGSRLARRLVADRLDEWGVPYGTAAHDDLVLITAELSTNAVRHGHVPGRDFHLRLRVVTAPVAPASLSPGSGPTGRTARIEVTDTRAERMPPHPGTLRNPGNPEESGDPGDEEGGRGLLLVSLLAARWGWHPCPGGPGKTVWAEYPLPGPAPS